MHVWLVQTWEPNPLDDPNGRPWRTGMLAQKLIEQGHSVTWFASNFAHSTKSFRRESVGPYKLSDNLTIWLIDALGYEKHVSLARLKDHRFVAKNFKQVANEALSPDIIVASYPTIEVCEQAAIVAKELNVPLLMDIRDQYPDLFWENASGPKKSLVKFFCKFTGLDSMAHRALASATGLTGNGPDVVQWGLQKAKRNQNLFDKTLFMSYEPKEFTGQETDASNKFWEEKYQISSGDKLIIYTGMLGQTIDFKTLVGAANQLPDYKFIICGGGDELESFKQMASKTSNIILTGWLDSPKIQALCSKARYGLIPYKTSPNFEKGITNKPVEYLSYGLPVLTTLQKGILAEMITAYDAGKSYDQGNSNHLVKLVQEIDADPDHYAQMCENAKSMFNENFHPDLVYGNWIKLICDVQKAWESRKG